tara:strand:- start:1704 stop:1829 length:126 start_codon:yes stop_codon:yes gene_type:complete
MNIAAKPKQETVKKVNKANRAVIVHKDPEEHIGYKKRDIKR